MSCGRCEDDDDPSGSPDDLSLCLKAHLTKRVVTSLKRRYWAHTSEAIRVAGNPKFVSADEAVACVPSNAVVATSGLGANQPIALLVRALTNRFKATAKPRNLSLVCCGGTGARGIARGTVEDWCMPGMLSRHFVGHAETYKTQLKAVDAGWLEMQIFPQGCISLLLQAQARRGEYSITLPGLHAGTFIDPRVGRGTPLAPPATKQYVAVDDGTGEFTYSLPPVTVAMFSAPAADASGNIYNRGAAVQSEMVEIAMAARRNRGLVIALVGSIVDAGYGDITIPHEFVDFIVVHRDVEQTLGAAHADALRFLTPDSTTSRNYGIARLRFMNRVLGATPRRTPADRALARLAASLLVPLIAPGCSVQIGTGMPEEVAAVLHNTGVLDKLTTIVESGTLGGLAAPGAYFGASVNPDRLVSSAEVFQRIYRHLDVILVGALQVDSQGNVNVSKRGEGAINYVGPGGFIDLTTSARVVMFCTTFFAKGKVSCSGANGGEMHVDWSKGKPCFVPEVDEVTFNGQEALKRGQQVFYITHVGAFKLTSRGVELVAVMPGVDPRRIVSAALPMTVVAPHGVGAPAAAPPSVITGRGYSLALTGDRQDGMGNVVGAAGAGIAAASVRGDAEGVVGAVRSKL